MEDNDVQLQLKKRARRRLVGAVFFVSVVALVLPVVMDQDPRPPVQDVEIRIPGQDDKPFAPGFASAPVEPVPKVVAEPVPDTRPEAKPAAAPAAAPAPAKPTARVIETRRDGDVETSAPNKPAVAKPETKPADKAVEKPADKVKPPVKPEPAKTAEKPKAENDEAKRAAAILSGKGGVEASPAAKGGDYLVLIGAFSDPGNVANLKKKLTELGIKTITEPLDTPQGKKTRVRAGPFPSRDAAEKALDKMKRIGVSGVISGKP